MSAGAAPPPSVRPGSWYWRETQSAGRAGRVRAHPRGRPGSAGFAEGQGSAGPTAAATCRAAPPPTTRPRRDRGRGRAGGSRSGRRSCSPRRAPRRHRHASTSRRSARSGDCSSRGRRSRSRRAAVAARELLVADRRRRPLLPRVRAARAARRGEVERRALPRDARQSRVAPVADLGRCAASPRARARPDPAAGAERAGEDAGGVRTRVPDPDPDLDPDPGRDRNGFPCPSGHAGDGAASPRPDLPVPPPRGFGPRTPRCPSCTVCLSAALNRLATPTAQSRCVSDLTSCSRASDAPPRRGCASRSRTGTTCAPSAFGCGRSGAAPPGRPGPARAGRPARSPAARGEAAVAPRRSGGGRPLPAVPGVGL
jgi:hypothetical protein